MCCNVLQAAEVDFLEDLAISAEMQRTTALLRDNLQHCPDPMTASSEAQASFNAQLGLDPSSPTWPTTLLRTA
jgi:hypothetical protein